MAWYNRNKNNRVVLPELEKYYEAERRERSGLAWILALVSVAGVALVLIGVFFGGRWAYRQIRNNDQPTTVAVKTVSTDSKPTDDKKDTAQTKDQTVTPPPTPVTPTPPATTAKPVTPTPPVVSTPAINKPSDGTTKLVDTGVSSIIPAFFTATAAGMFIYRRKLKSSN